MNVSIVSVILWINAEAKPKYGCLIANKKNNALKIERKITFSLGSESLKHCGFAVKYEDGVTRRLMCRWTVSHVSAQLANVQMHLFGDSSRPMSDKFITKNNDDTFFVGLDRLSYIRESMPQVCFVVVH
ncbi:unnamed protein product [Anisakis simplex]|uniref:CUB domain-containing protein n=1 Tax=Anisakis simplex TaxID=6269 RepID=A0A0M3JFS5_ANISI|nr:unnamed protein product [Anisakis simplex]